MVRGKIMKILIVDDELLVRIGLKSSINWDKHGFEIVGEASNGQEALEKIHQCKPDLLLLDIKMPVMDGIELLKKLKEERNPCRSVILSSFDDLEHVKEAMKLGALDYLHKPCMNPEGIIKVLTEINKELINEKKDYKDYVQNIGTKREDTAESFLRKLVDGQLTDDAEFQRGLKENHIGLGRSNFSCIVFSVINLDKIEKRYSDENKNLLCKSILDILGQVFLSEAEVVFFNYSKNLYTAVMTMEKIASVKEIIDMQNRYVHLITDSLKKFLDIDVGIGISGIHQSFKRVKTAFEEAYKALQRRFYHPAEKVIHYNTLTSFRDSRQLLNKIDEFVIKLKENVSSHNYYQYKSNTEEIFKLLRENPVLSSEEVIKLFNGILFLLDELGTCFEEMKLISCCETLEELHDAFRKIIDQKLYNMEENEYKNYSFIVKNIISYINRHYTEELSLSMIAEHLNVSPNYISRVFKEEVGKTLFNYVNEVRVEQAKKLMHKKELKIYEIGEKVGFNSSVHFNIVFNKLTGYSPKQYRDRILG